MKNLNQALSANSAANAEDVMATKIFLRNQGHYIPPEWGISQFPDRAMFDALKAFQKSQGLKVDGVMKPEGETETAIKEQAQKLQSMGRNGDTILAHITPAEAQLLHDITDGGSINPETGLPEFFFGDFFGGLTDSFSSIGTSLSDSFSSFGDSLSSFGDSFSDGFSDAFKPDTSLSDTQKKIGELDSLASSDAYKSIDAKFQPGAAANAGNFGSVMDNLKPREMSVPKSTPQIALNTKSGQTHVGAAQQAQNLKIMKQQEIQQKIVQSQATKALATPLATNRQLLQSLSPVFPSAMNGSARKLGLSRPKIRTKDRRITN